MELKVYYKSMADHLTLDYDWYIDVEATWEPNGVLTVKQKLENGKTKAVVYNKDSWVKMEVL